MNHADLKRRLADLICRVWGHSPVWRTGYWWRKRNGWDMEEYRAARRYCSRCGIRGCHQTSLREDFIRRWRDAEWKPLPRPGPVRIDLADEIPF